MLSKEELETYCKEYYSIIYRYCLNRLSNKEDAEDATQETFVVFSRKAHLIEAKHIKPWLLSTAHYMVLNVYKKRYLAKEKQSVFDEEMLEISRRVKTFEESLIDYYAEKYVDDIYMRLSDKEKELFDLFCADDMKTGEIANILGLEPHACSMRKKRLMERCRDIMIEILFY